ncbi:hypothetical protein [Dongia sedimenti]|uniref:Uncharacterized protein n=1 Tax=Dongia sedimenti TaxID=3064282 RepID=A0ABU0YLB0_9PROT|nr:hypothetical protein [Rhodospirillaceae bacterium R-7]
MKSDGIISARPRIHAARKISLHIPEFTRLLRLTRAADRGMIGALFDIVNAVSRCAPARP